MPRSGMLVRHDAPAEPEHTPPPAMPCRMVQRRQRPHILPWQISHVRDRLYRTSSCRQHCDTLTHRSQLLPACGGQLRVGLAHLLGSRDQHRLRALDARADRAAAQPRRPGRRRLLVRQHRGRQRGRAHDPVHSRAVPALLVKAEQCLQDHNLRQCMPLHIASAAAGRTLWLYRLRKDTTSSLLPGQAEDLGLEMIEAQCAARGDPSEPRLLTPCLRQSAACKQLGTEPRRRVPALDAMSCSLACVHQGSAGSSCQQWCQSARHLQSLH